MKKPLWRPKLIFAFCLLFLACPADDCDSGPAGPSPIPTTTTTIEPQSTRPPRVDERADLYDFRGCTAFGAAALSEQELVSFIYHIQGRCDMIRVGAQTDGWANSGISYLEASVGPQVGTPEWEENLHRLLDVTARIPGVRIQLIPTFTHKNESLARCMEITKAVVAIQQAGSEDDPRPYEHVVWDAVNEYRHPLSTLSRDDVAKLLEFLRTTGLPVGTDGPGRIRDGVWRGEYPQEFLPLVDYISFHPPRNDFINGICTPIEPDYWALRKTVNSYSKPVWFEETTCYISDASKALYGIGRSGHYALCGEGTERARQRLIEEYKWDVEGAGGVWFTHASWLFECRRLGWLAE